MDTKIKNKIKNILINDFKLDKFRNKQEDIILNIINKKNTLVIMPTGGGKSLTFQIPGVYNPGTTLVISPLISLMKDQVDSLNNKNIPSYFYNSSLSNEEKQEIFSKINDNLIKFLYISPERLDMEYFIESIKFNLNISLIVIDEAHCISSWGHDFRKSYLNLSKLSTIFKNVPIIALTATADHLTKKEISNEFNITEENIFQEHVQRNNLQYFIEKKYKDGFAQVEQVIKKNKGKKGIVYCFKKDDVNKLTRQLRIKKLSVKAYHADLTDRQKENVMNDFMNDKIDVIVATIAFGMGIDKSNIRYIIHKDIPKNIESYYQETGRAGRDGLLSKAYLFYSGRDATQRIWVLNNSNRKTIDMNKFSIMKSFVETVYCKKNIINWYFDNDKIKDNCGKCSICLNKNIEKKEDKDFLTYINDSLMNKEKKDFFIKEFIKEMESKTHFSANIIQNYIWQLIFDNKIIFNKMNNKISLDKKIDTYQFNDLIDIEYNFEIKEKKKKRVVKKKKNPSVLKKNYSKKKSRKEKN